MLLSSPQTYPELPVSIQCVSLLPPVLSGTAALDDLAA
jgi:hypothetical protein